MSVDFWAFSLSGESRRPVSDSFPSGFSYSRTTPAQDSCSPPTKVPLRKVSSENKSDSDPVWKKASGGPLARQASEGGVGKHDVGKGKLFTRQLSKGVSVKSLLLMEFLWGRLSGRCLRLFYVLQSIRFCYHQNLEKWWPRCFVAFIWVLNIFALYYLSNYLSDSVSGTFTADCIKAYGN